MPYAKISARALNSVEIIVRIPRSASCHRIQSHYSQRFSCTSSLLCNSHGDAALQPFIIISSLCFHIDCKSIPRLVERILFTIHILPWTVHCRMRSETFNLHIGMEIKIVRSKTVFCNVDFFCCKIHIKLKFVQL